MMSSRCKMVVRMRSWRRRSGVDRETTNVLVPVDDLPSRCKVNYFSGDTCRFMS